MAGEAPEWAVPLAEQALRRAADEGREVSVAELQSEIGAGAEDTAAVLDVLRERGAAVEEAPGVWRGPYADEGGVPVPSSLAESRERLTEGNARAAEVAVQIAEGGRSAPVETKLTIGMVALLSGESIGALVQAGVADAAGQPFVLRVDP